MIKNPWTTIPGYLTLIGAVVLAVAHCMQGNCLGAGDITVLMGAMAGIGLISAKDGGH